MQRFQFSTNAKAKEITPEERKKSKDQLHSHGAKTLKNLL